MQKKSKTKMYTILGYKLKKILFDADRHFEEKSMMMTLMKAKS